MRAQTRRRLRRLGRQRLAIGQQMAAMRSRFSQFTYKRHDNVPTWLGTLQPTETSPKYCVEITYRLPKAPEVRVLSPTLHPDAPHRYPDGSLCLYYPRDCSWTPAKFIADTIVPWTALWLAFYDLWLRAGEWYGPEAPHGKKKRPHP